MSSGVMVTGGAGFIGSELVKALLARGEKVTVFDNLSTGRRNNVPAGVRLVVGDIGDPKDAPLLQDAMAGHGRVVHFAARVAIRSSFDFIIEDTLTNVVGTAALMRAVRATPTVRRVLAASSMAVYADSAPTLPVAENHPVQPLSPYGVSKLAMEQLVHLCAAGTGVTSVALRFFNTYGVGQQVSPYVGAITIFTNALLQGLSPVVFGDGEQSRDFVHVDDIVDGCLRALEASCNGQTYNLGAGCPTTVNEVLQQVQRALGTNLPVQYAPRASGELRCSYADISFARRSLGYSPKRRLDEALPAVVTEIARAQRQNSGGPRAL